MSLDSDLKRFCDHLRSRLDIDVVVGRPNDALPGLYVWPWRMMPTMERRNAPPPQESGPGVPSFRVSCLLLITLADTLETCAKLDAAAQVIQETPILEGAGGGLRVMFDTTSAEDMAALFSAARLPLTLCLPFVLEGSSDP